MNKICVILINKFANQMHYMIQIKLSHALNIHSTITHSNNDKIHRNAHLLFTQEQTFVCSLKFRVTTIYKISLFMTFYKATIIGNLNEPG